MATGFIARHSKWILILCLATAPALAQEVTFVGPFGDKGSVIAVGGGPPKGLRVGQSFQGITLISVEKDTATVEIGGKRSVLRRGQTYSTAGSSDRGSVTLSASPGGHYVVDGQVNGGTMRLVVDTGATLIALPASDARRLCIDYRKGEMSSTQTAAGPTAAWRVRLESVRVGGIELNNIEAIVIEQGLPIGLLGMSFLNRVEMRQEAGRMTMIKRF
jgi:aspartyl protease family protein